MVPRIATERGAAAATSGCFLLIFKREQGRTAAARRVLQAGREEQPRTLPSAFADVCLLFFGQRCLQLGLGLVRLRGCPGGFRRAAPLELRHFRAALGNVVGAGR